MAKPISYRKVGKGIKKRCENCAHFVDSNSWCKKWSFPANEIYTCSKWKQQLGEIGEESELKKRYRVAIGDDIMEREENYAQPYTPEPNENDYKVGFIYRYFAKQKNNPYSQVVEINEKQYRSAGSATTGIDGTHYDVVRVQWTITGNMKFVQKTNTRISDYIEARNPKMIGLKEYLYSNLMRFWEGGKKA
tara:strand:+ start:5546 stop:6118 length:573 start_codon:yes stop_codon:yes gene_type:complete